MNKKSKTIIPLLNLFIIPPLSSYSSEETCFQSPCTFTPNSHRGMKKHEAACLGATEEEYCTPDNSNKKT
jgi:hypothetical protein